VSVHVFEEGGTVVIYNDDHPGDTVEVPVEEWRAYLGYAHSDDRAQWETLCWEALSLLLQASTGRGGWEVSAQKWEQKFKLKVEANMKWDSVRTPITEDAPSVSTDDENGDGVPSG